MTTILIARPAAEARQTAERLTAQGYEAIVTPALTITPVNAARPNGDFQGIFLTSANALPWLAIHLAALRPVPVFAVGARTAEAARAAGFTDVRAADGDRVALAQLVTSTLPKGARLLAPVGRDHHQDIPAALIASGYDVVSPVVYAAAMASELTAEALAALRYDVADAVLHYSPRSAAAFLSLLRQSDIDPASLQMRHVCLSRAVAEALPEGLGDRIIVADQPDESALFAALDRAMGTGSAVKGMVPSSESRAAKGRKARPRAFAIDASANPSGDRAAGKTVAAMKRVDETAAQAADTAETSAAPTRTIATAGAEAAPSPAASAPPPVLAEAVAGPMEEPAAHSLSVSSPGPDRPAASPDTVSTPSSAGWSAATGPAVKGKAMPDATIMSDASAATSAGQATAAVPPGVSRPRRIVLPVLSAAVVGGLIGGAAALFVPPYLPAGWLPERKGPDVPGLVAAAVQAQTDARLATLAARSDVDALKQDTATGLAQRTQAITGVQRAVDDLARRVADVDKMARAAPEQAAAALRTVVDLGKRVDLLDGVAKVPYDIVGLSKRVDDIASRKPEAQPDLAPLDARLAAANAAIAALQSKLDALAARPVPDTGRPVRIHALATGIAEALARGQPFKVELDAVTAAGAGGVPLQALAAYADKGAPTGAVLAKQFEPLGPQIVQALQPPPPPNAGFMDKVRAMASGMVRVRPAGPAAGDTPAALVSRIEAALARNQFGEALTAWQALPEPARALSAGFGQALKNRAEAAVAARAFVDDATRALARQGQ